MAVSSLPRVIDITATSERSQSLLYLSVWYKLSVCSTVDIPLWYLFLSSFYFELIHHMLTLFLFVSHSIAATCTLEDTIVRWILIYQSTPIRHTMLLELWIFSHWHARRPHTRNLSIRLGCTSSHQKCAWLVGPPPRSEWVSLAELIPSQKVKVWERTVDVIQIEPLLRSQS